MEDWKLNFFNYLNDIDELRQLYLDKFGQVPIKPLNYDNSEIDMCVEDSKLKHVTVESKISEIKDIFRGLKYTNDDVDFFLTQKYVDVDGTTFRAFKQDEAFLLFMRAVIQKLWVGAEQRHVDEIVKFVSNLNESYNLVFVLFPVIHTFTVENGEIKRQVVKPDDSPVEFNSLNDFKYMLDNCDKKVGTVYLYQLDVVDSNLIQHWANGITTKYTKDGTGDVREYYQIRYHISEHEELKII